MILDGLFVSIAGRYLHFSMCSLLVILSIARDVSEQVNLVSVYDTFTVSYGI